MNLKNLVGLPLIIFIIGYTVLQDYEFHAGLILWFGIWFAFVIYYGFQENWEYDTFILILSFMVWCGAVVYYNN